MNWIKILGYSIVIVLIVTVLPIPLAAFVDMTFHWLLLVTIPAGVILISILAIIRQVLVEKRKKQKK